MCTPTFDVQCQDVIRFLSKHVSFSKVDALTLLHVGIKTGPLFLIPDQRQAAEEKGSTEVDGKALTMDVLKQLIALVRRHVSVVVSHISPSGHFPLSTLFSQSEAGCRVLINLILLRVASSMSIHQIDVNIIPEFPISKTVFHGNLSFGGVVDFLLTKLPEKYTRKRNSSYLRTRGCNSPHSEFLLADPTGILANPEEIKGTVSSNIFEAKRDNVRSALPQAVIAAASHCKQHQYEFLFLACSSYNSIVCAKFISYAWLHYEWRTMGFLHL